MGVPWQVAFDTPSPRSFPKVPCRTSFSAVAKASSSSRTTPSNRRALILLLSQLGFDTVSVATVAEGYERLDGQDRAILDLNLPDGLGTDVMQRIIDEHRPIRVLVTTGSTSAELLGEANRLRAEQILRKPINVNQLVDWLNDAG